MFSSFLQTKNSNADIIVASIFTETKSFTNHLQQPRPFFPDRNRNGGKEVLKKIKKIATRTRRRIRVERSIRIPSAIEENDHLLSNRENDEEGWETEGESHLGAGKGLRKKMNKTGIKGSGAGRKRDDKYK